MSPREITLPRWFAMTILPFEQPSAHGHIVQLPAADATFHRRLPLPLLYWMPDADAPVLAGIIDDVFLERGLLRAGGKFDHSCVAGRHLALRIMTGERVPVEPDLYTPAFDFQVAQLLRQEQGDDVQRWATWLLVGVRADPPQGPPWDCAQMWNV